MNPFRGIGLKLASVTCFVVMAALIKLASERGMHIAEIIFWRQLDQSLKVSGAAALGGRALHASWRLLTSPYGPR